jgi:hypothetical protein
VQDPKKTAPPVAQTHRTRHYMPTCRTEAHSKKSPKNQNRLYTLLTATTHVARAGTSAWGTSPTSHEDVNEDERKPRPGPTATPAQAASASVKADPHRRGVPTGTWVRVTSANLVQTTFAPCGAHTRAGSLKLHGGPRRRRLRSSIDVGRAHGSGMRRRRREHQVACLGARPRVGSSGGGGGGGLALRSGREAP